MPPRTCAGVVRGVLSHDEDRPGGILDRFSPEDLDDILAYLTTLQPRDSD